MTTQIAILGWGSLLWDPHPEFDEHHHPWKFDGPEIKLEFSRISQSRRGALTLVIDPRNGELCRIAYALSKRNNPEDAINDIQSRERTTRIKLGYFFAGVSPNQSRDSESFESIRVWAEAKKFDMVVWTDLCSNFEKVCGRPFQIDAALAYVKSLDADAKVMAAEYVWRAPALVNTPLRRALQVQPWFPK